MDKSEELFGTTVRGVPTGDHQPDRDYLRMVAGKGHIPIHCQGCGNRSLSLSSMEAADHFARKIGANPPDSWIGRFARVQNCLDCADDFTGLTAENIDED